MGTDAPRPAGLAWLPLVTAIALTLGLTAYPQVLADASGQADHGAALLSMWAMSAGFVRGVGFIPCHRLPRMLLSGGACLLALTLALLKIANP